MMRTWRMLVLPALITTGLAVAPAPAGETRPLTESGKTVQEQLKEMERRLGLDFGKVADDIKDLALGLKSYKGEQTDVKTKLSLALGKLTALDLTIADLRGEIDTLRKRLPDVRLYNDPSDKAAFEDIKARLAQIETTLLKIQERGRLSLASPVPAAAGRIVLINTYSEELSFVVNGRAYRVAPGTRVPLEGHPSGAFTYEVISPSWGLRGRNTTSLAPGETFTITASP